MKYKFVPYDPKLVEQARKFRKSETIAEKKFWFEILKDKKLSGFKFTRQKPIGNFVVDFYCAKFKFGIEIDGPIHKFIQARDRERDNLLKQKFGLMVIRYRNEDVLKNPGKIIDDLLSKLSP